MAHSTRTRDETPTAAEYGQLIAYLATQGNLTAQQLRQELGSGPADRSRREISQDVTAWLARRDAA